MRPCLCLIPMLLSPLVAADRFPVPTLAPADLAGPPAQAEPFPSGLSSVTLKPGVDTAHPAADALVTIDFTVWLEDGKVMDTTAHADKPFTRPMDRLLPGMREALRLMTQGERRRVWLPAALAFNGAPNRPSGGLIVEMELLAFEPSPFVAPPDLAGPADDATLFPSGLAMRMLKAGKGTRKPGERSTVFVHYSGWTSDGRLFESTWKTAQTAQFRLDQVIRGWTEGIQRMVPGDKARFWVPQKMAYRGEAGKPAGMLVFDIELLDFVQ